MFDLDWTGGTKSSAGWLFCFSTAAINLNIWIKLSDPKAALAKGNILRGKNMNTLARGVGWSVDKSWLECWRCHFRVKTRTNCLRGLSKVESEDQWSPMWTPQHSHHNPSPVYICLSSCDLSGVNVELFVSLLPSPVQLLKWIKISISR